MSWSVVTKHGPGVVASLIWTFVPDVFPQLPQNVTIEFSIDHLSWWNKFLTHHAFNIQLLPRLRLWFWSHLAEFEAEFDANPLLLQISHFSRSVRSQNSTNTTSQKCTGKTHHHSRKLLGRVVNKGYSSRYLAACNCTTSSFHAAFQFRGFGSTMYMCVMYSFSLTWGRHRGGTSNETMPVEVADNALK